MWEVLDTGSRSALENMQIDATLLEQVQEREKPLIHFYEWEGDSATYGYFTDPDSVLNLEGVLRRGLQLAKRPTGGGILFHLWDMAFSVIVPARSPLFSLNTLDNYAFVNSIVLKSVNTLLGDSAQLELTPQDFDEPGKGCSHFCMAKPTKYDVVWKGKKVAGAAQRKTRFGFLHQGTISLLFPSEDYLRDVLASDADVLDAMKRYTFPLFPGGAGQEEMPQVKKELKALLTTYLNEHSLKFKGF
ncbi:MAG: hypothetical protein HYZ48_01850 [Chlamydiales bacterium]|nr:hypothetical protein [Chlamydiales bacterium]